MLRVVFDTVVFVRSLINPCSFWGKIILKYSKSYRLFVSKPVLQEILEVLNRPEITSLFHSLEGLDKEKIIEIVNQAEKVEIFDIPTTSRDIEDDKFLATAKAANAHFLITADKDLLDLKEYEKIKIINAETFIEILKELEWEWK